MTASASDHPATGKFDYVIHHVETRAALRQWLADNHATERGAWILSWKPHLDRPFVDYAAYCEELICWGWIDSTQTSLGEDRRMQLSTPRKAKSTWTRLNRRRVEEQEAAGQMTDAGWRAVEAAKASGWWTILDSVEDLVEPDELAAALDAVPAARATWDAFPKSPKKMMLWWVKSAVRDDTRTKRITAIVDKASVGERAQG